MGAKVAAGSAIVLLLVMAFFSWFASDAGSVNAWQAFGVIDVVLVLAAAAGIAMAVTGADSTGRPPMPVAFAAASLGLLALTLIVFRIIDPPDLDATAITKAVDVFGVDGAEVRLGSYLGLIAVAGIAWGGWTSTGVDGSRRNPDRPRAGVEQSRTRPRSSRPDPPEAELPVSQTAAQRAADRAERRRRSQSSSD